MIPEPILNKDSIGVCTPDEKGDFILGLYLYDIKESEEIRGNTMINRGMAYQKYPPTYLTLSYMVTAFSKSDIKTKFLDDQRILGRAIQVITDNAFININEITKSPDLLIKQAKMELLSLSNEDKIKIWNNTNNPYRLSFCFSVTPVELESTRMRKVSRVIEVAANVEEKKNR